MNESKSEAINNSNIRGLRAAMRHWTISAVLTFVTVFVLTGATFQKSEQRGNEQGNTERFDNLVREDLFAGFEGDTAAFERAMKLCADTLAKNPKHAQAMVWQGSGFLHLAGLAYAKGDAKQGKELWDRGLKQMDNAVKLEPDNVAVLIPRGASLLEASREVPVPEIARELLEKGVSDYEKVLELQRSYFAQLSVHARAQLLFGLGEGFHRLGNKEKAHVYLSRLVKECPQSKLQERAKSLLDESKPPSKKQDNGCVGCHS